MNNKLDLEELTKLLQPDGRLAISLSQYEFRPQQVQMLENVAEAFNQRAIAIIEAGTGTGKSIAYLIPAIAAAIYHKERTVISTHTIHLQEQILLKDIPFLTRTLGLTIKASLVKGMGNYICRRKIEDLQEELPELTNFDQKQMEEIIAWSNQTKDGSLSDLSFQPKSSLWELVNADPETCNRRQCPHFKQCHLFKARKEAEDAHLIIVNHSILFADLVLKSDDSRETTILPHFHHLILDEAHHLEDIATEFFAKRASRISMMRILGRIGSEKNGSGKGKLHLLSSRIINRFGIQFDPKISSILAQLQIDLPAMRRDVQIKLHETFDQLVTFFDEMKLKDLEETKLRMLSEVYQRDTWIHDLIPILQQCISSAKNYCQSVETIEKEIDDLKDESLNSQTSGLRLELLGLIKKLRSQIEVFQNFIHHSEDNNSVRWMEIKKFQTFDNIHLFDAKLDISQILIETLFTRFHSITLCSATLTTNQKFSFIKQRLGIEASKLSNRPIIENLYASPFNYEQQALFAVPNDLPNPNHPEFLKQASNEIQKIIEISRGNAFILFTSFFSLESIFQTLRKWLEENQFPVFKQGDFDRRTLLEKFKKTDRAILFGTSSFWEGVDVVGDSLRLVILVKIPFQVPTEPILQARTEAIDEQGGNSFMDYLVPNAIVKFKQGFGRLIRNKNDRGCIVCLDTRLITKPYGKLFLNSIPECKKIYDSRENIQRELKKFYTQTT